MPVLAFFCCLFLAQAAFCAEEYELSNAPETKTQSPPQSHWLIHDDQGSKLETLPEGYVLNKQGDILVFDGVTFLANGYIQSPQGPLKAGELPDGYSRQANGSILTPDGLVLFPPKPDPQEQKPSAKSEKKPEQTALWQMLPLTDEQEEKNKKAPEEHSQAKPQASPKKDLNQKFTIPGSAYASKDLSFLQGCWESSDLPAFLNIWHDTKKQGKLTKTRICFQGKGKGSIRYYDHGICNGKIQAHFAPNKLSLQSSRANCPDGTSFAVRYFDCYGQGSKTQCAVIAKYKGHTRRSLVHFTKAK